MWVFSLLFAKITRAIMRERVSSKGRAAGDNLQVMGSNPILYSLLLHQNTNEKVLI